MSIFRDLTTVENDAQKMAEIDRLQEAFNQVRASYAAEHDSSMRHAISEVRERLEKNPGMIRAVQLYTERFVAPDRREAASAALFELLAAELLQTMNALQHTACVVQ